MRAIATVLLGLSVLLDGVAFAVTATAAPVSRDTGYQAIIVECRRMYAGQRSRAVMAGRPMYVEGCFHQRTGKYPWQAGVTL
jgi:hypothetical protein